MSDTTHYLSYNGDEYLEEKYRESWDCPARDLTSFRKTGESLSQWHKNWVLKGGEELARGGCRAYAKALRLEETWIIRSKVTEEQWVQGDTEADEIAEASAVFGVS